MKKISKNYLLFSAILFTTLLAACASNSPPASLDTARLAIQEATRYEAPLYAASELNLARQKLQQAEVASNNGNKKEAGYLADQATVDARYAQTRAQAQRAQIAALETKNTTNTLKHLRK